ncbi:hypothetical protein CMV_010985 [Castanea mollissima]|uniref:Uncharacterized protein n=1 Tax=Castanea mollissima TaxID=60419 RepID=A0A8J4W0D0_9ROSI|nr:hypothetical protein CMV_010985 [Castanea mollissima]
MVALDKIYYTPVGKFMDERDAAIRAKLSDVKDTSGEVKQLEEQAAAVMKAARAEIAAALSKMKKETQEEVEQKLAEGRKKVEAELQEALASLELQKEETLKALDSQIAALSQEIVKKSKYKVDSSATHPISLDEPEFEAEPEPISVYRPTAEENSASMGTRMGGFFDEANVVFSTATSATPAAPQGVPTEEAVKDGSSLVVTPSSISSSTTRGLDADLSSEESEDILKDLDDEPTKKKRVSKFEGEEEEDSEHEVEFMETSEEPKVVANKDMPTATSPTTPVAPIFAVPAALILTGPGPLPTILSQFEVGSSSATVPDLATTKIHMYSRDDRLTGPTKSSPQVWNGHGLTILCKCCGWV